ncbi:MAG: OsmC family protein [Gemmatimonadota bacterium]
MADISVVWKKDLEFEGLSGAHRIPIDGNSEAGPSPVTLMLQSVAACVGTDVVDILRKGRQDLRGLNVEVEAERRTAHPRWVKSLLLRFYIEGDVSLAKAERAVDLGLEKYCSVFHTFRKDMALDVSVTVSSANLDAEEPLKNAPHELEQRDQEYLPHDQSP